MRCYITHKTMMRSIWTQRVFTHQNSNSYRLRYFTQVVDKTNKTHVRNTSRANTQNKHQPKTTPTQEHPKHPQRKTTRYQLSTTKEKQSKTSVPSQTKKSSHKVSGTEESIEPIISSVPFPQQSDMSKKAEYRRRILRASKDSSTPKSRFAKDFGLADGLKRTVPSQLPRRATRYELSSTKETNSRTSVPSQTKSSSFRVSGTEEMMDSMLSSVSFSQQNNVSRKVDHRRRQLRTSKGGSKPKSRFTKDFGIVDGFEGTVPIRNRQAKDYVKGSVAQLEKQKKSKWQAFKEVEVQVPEYITLKQLSLLSQVDVTRILLTLANIGGLESIDRRTSKDSKLSDISHTLGTKLSPYLLEVLKIEAANLSTGTGNERLAQKSEQVLISKLGMTKQQLLFIADSITVSYETAELVSLELPKQYRFKCIPYVERIKDETLTVFPPDLGEKRSPIVTVMGHVDHGKTTLLDTLRNASVASGEEGGITQSVGAFRVSLDRIQQNLHGPKTVNEEKRSKELQEETESVVFLDTPGHEAFNSMRKCGTQITDLALVVVSATDGLQPQTIESIQLALANSVPIIVAVTKIDAVVPFEQLKDKSMSELLELPAIGVTLEKVSTELIVHGVETELIGGTIQIIPISAPKYIGLDSLIEALSLQAELMSLKAPRDVRGEAIVLESRVDKHLGVVCDLIVKHGTLKPGNIVVVNENYAKIRQIMEPSSSIAVNKNLALSQAIPSDPVRVTGLSFDVPAGSEVLVVDSISRAKEVAKLRGSKLHQAEKNQRMLENAEVEETVSTAVILEDAQYLKYKELIKSEEIHQFFRTQYQGLESVIQPVILKAETDGSLNALKYSIENISLKVQQQAEQYSKEVEKLKKTLFETLKTTGQLDEMRVLEEIRSKKTKRVLPLNSGFKVIEAGVGAITEQDMVQVDQFKDVVILGFNVRSTVKGLLKGKGGKRKGGGGERVYNHGVIYHLLDDAKKLLFKHLPNVERHETVGRAEVLQLFTMTTKKKSAWVVAGCKVRSGQISKKSRIRIIRENQIIHETSGIDSLNYFKERVALVKTDQDCGISLNSFSEYKVGDYIEAYDIVQSTAEA